MLRKHWPDVSTKVADTQNQLSEVIAPFSNQAWPTSQIEISLSCENVKTILETYCIVKLKEPWKDEFTEIGRTEEYDGTINPEWATKFVIEYHFERFQRLRFEMMVRDELLGEFETTFSDIVSSHDSRFTGALEGTEGGQIIIVPQEMPRCKQVIPKLV